jgi:hypothetical protein
MVTETETQSDAIRAELPEIEQLQSEDLRVGVLKVWGSFLDASSYDRIADAPAFPGLPKYDLARHTRHVCKNALHLADTLEEFWDIRCQRDLLLAACLLHDSSKLVEMEGPDGAATPTGRALLHAQLAGVRCLDFGLPYEVVYMVTYHPYTPPHVHIKPESIEHIILTWADLAACDPPFFVEGQATHLEITKRFFQL